MRLSLRCGWLLALGLVVAAASAGCSSCHDTHTDSCGYCGPPLSSAGEDVGDCQVGRMVILRGSVRLPPEDTQVCLTEKDSLIFQWEQVSGPEVEIIDADQRDAYFIPTVPGTYKFRFQVLYPITEINCEPQYSQWDTVTIECGPVVCGSPTADAGEDQEIATRPGIPQTAVLDGIGSHPVFQEGCDCLPLTYAWTQVSGANVVIANDDHVQASVELSSFGDYEFQLEVTDTCGTSERTNTDTDTVAVTLVEKAGCASILDVTAIDGLTGEVLSGVHVSVVDSGGNLLTMDTDSQGVASFGSLADGVRRFITLVSDEVVPAHPWVGGADRKRFETTTVVNHCSRSITVPLRKTASGDAAESFGTVVAKVPRSVFSMLPHSWQCAGQCNSDADCDETYYCELDETTPCGPHSPDVTASCTPRSLLPFFNLSGRPYISGQFRFVVLLPVVALNDPVTLPMGKLYPRPPADGAVLPGNLTTDDTFLNGLAPSLGLDTWGDSCVRTSDCPNTIDYICEQDPQGDYRCKDKNPMRNFRMEVPAGPDTRLIMIAGIADVSMEDFLQIFFPSMMGDNGVSSWDITAGLWSSAIMRTLHICPVVVDVTADAENDISAYLETITKDNCWNIDYQQKDSVVALEYPLADSVDSCSIDLDCCDGPGHCGWPDSGKKCLVDPDGGSKGCYTPMLRVEVASCDDLIILPPTGGFDPTAPRSDTRLCSHVPDQAPFEVMCPTPTPNQYISCDPKDIRDLDVPADYECSFPYGLAAAALDFPPGHTALPEGGRVFVGFNFNRTPLSEQPSPRFLVPNLEANSLQGARINIVQTFMRNIIALPDGAFDMLPGYLGATTLLSSNAAQAQLSDFLPLLSPQNVPDAGLTVEVTFLAQDPTRFPPELTRTYAEAMDILVPQAGIHDLPGTVEFVADPNHDLISLVLGKVDRVGRDIVVDHWWRIYIPAATTSITLPAEVSPFITGDEVWVQFQASSFRVPFDFDLFPAEMILRQKAASSADSYALIAF
jgi:hypothetical protein